MVWKQYSEGRSHPVDNANWKLSHFYCNKGYNVEERVVSSSVVAWSVRRMRGQL